MAEAQIDVDAAPERVWAVLADPRSYVEWVVGAQRLRGTDGEWPAVGSKLHHSVGAGPVTFDDETAVVESDEPRRLVLHAKAGPFGEFTVDIRLVPQAEGTRVVLAEDPAGGVAATVSPVTELVNEGRTAFSLRNLKHLAETA